MPPRVVLYSVLLTTTGQGSRIVVINGIHYLWDRAGADKDQMKWDIKQDYATTI